MGGKLPPPPNQTWCIASALQFSKGVAVDSGPLWVAIILSIAAFSAGVPSFRGLFIRSYQHRPSLGTCAETTPGKGGEPWRYSFSTLTQYLSMLALLSLSALRTLGKHSLLLRAPSAVRDSPPLYWSTWPSTTCHSMGENKLRSWCFLWYRLFLILS